MLTPAGVPFLWLAQRAGLATPTAFVLVMCMLVVAAVVGYTGHRVLVADPSSVWRMHVRAIAGVIATGAVIHPLGWGPTFILAYLFTALELTRRAGSRAMPIALGWITAAVVAGQVGIELDLIPSVLPPLEAHVSALCSTAAVLALSQLFGLTVARAETAEWALGTKARHYESLVRHAADIIGVIDDDGKVLTANPAIERILGVPLDRILGSYLHEYIVGQPMESVRAIADGVATAVANEDMPVVRRCMLRHTDGSERHLVITFTTPSQDWNGRTIINIHDTTTQHELERQLRFEATHDPLTGLLNRRAFAELLSDTLRRNRVSGRGLAMLYLDLDGFKQVNDTFGHDRGDKVLLEAACRIRDLLVAGESMARLGGDEFCILLDDPSPTRPMGLADRIVDAVSEPIAGLPSSLRVGVSIGIATTERCREAPDELLTSADRAMYMAKHRGKSGWAVACDVVRAAVDSAGS